MAGTTITPYTADQFAQRLARAFPNGWASQTAKQQGGTLYALFKSLGADLSVAHSAIAYALGSTRIGTATAPELDIASQDFLGNLLPRLPGETDAAYSVRILQQLPPTGATRPAIIAALKQLTGATPRVVEPWSPADTGCWDLVGGIPVSYWDVDTAANPAQWADPGLRWQGFIITKPPPPLPGGPIIQCFDRGNGANGAYWDVPGYGFMELQLVSNSQVYATIARLHVEGTIVWVKIQDPAAFH